MFSKLGLALVAVGLLTDSVGARAEAELNSNSAPKKLVSNLSRIEVNPEAAQALDLVSGTTGFLTLDTEDTDGPEERIKYKFARLTALRAATCPTQAACAPDPYEIVLPVVKVTLEPACGELRIVAQQDLRPVDRNFSQLIIVAQPKVAKCQTFAHVPEVQADLTILTNGRDTGGRVREMKLRGVGDRFKKALP